MWAATVDVSRVSPEAQAKLIPLQDEFAEALAREFVDGPNRRARSVLAVQIADAARLALQEADEETEREPRLTWAKPGRVKGRPVAAEAPPSELRALLGSGRPVEAIFDEIEPLLRARLSKREALALGQRRALALSKVLERCDALEDGGHEADALKEIESQRRALEIVPSAGARIRARIGAPPVLHVPTGLPTLDEMTRGGFLTERVAVLGGQPDAGKTSFATQIAVAAARDGFAVVFHCADEPREGIESRIGQAEGLSLADLEGRDPAVLEELARIFDNLPTLALVDQDDDEMTLEDSAELAVSIARRHGCKGIVVVGDSLQTVLVRGLDSKRTEKERIDAVAAAVKRIARRTPAFVLVTSELARIAYRARRAKDRAMPMAQRPRTDYMERALDVLDSHPKGIRGGIEGWASHVQGNRPRLREACKEALALGHAVMDSDMVIRSPRAAETAEDAALVMTTAIVGLVRANPGATKAFVRAACVGRSATVLATIDALIEAGRIEDRGEPGQAALYLRAPTETLQ
jgi:KaiC/GvpD/RAD55 family RecA-like ATPase